MSDGCTEKTLTPYLLPIYFWVDPASNYDMPSRRMLILIIVFIECCSLLWNTVIVTQLIFFVQVKWNS